jgi:DNA-binding Lrp family transcriptional regulator
MGYIFIKTYPKMEVSTYRDLKKVKEIKELTPLFGDYDLIAKIEAKEFSILSDIVLHKIRTHPGVEDTKTIPGTNI